MQPHEVQHLVQNEYAQTSIRVKARQLCRRRDFGHSCRDDVEQDLWLHLLIQAAKFDGDRSSLNTFIDRMVNSAAAILVRSREREMHADGFHMEPLDAAPRGKETKKRSLRSSLACDASNDVCGWYRNGGGDWLHHSIVGGAKASTTTTLRKVANAARETSRNVKDSIYQIDDLGGLFRIGDHRGCYNVARCLIWNTPHLACARRLRCAAGYRTGHRLYRR